jgi:alanyl-tRNA synthetase
LRPILKNSTQQRRLKNLDFIELNVNANITTGVAQKNKTPAVTLSKQSFKFSCVGKYEFIGRGCGIGRKGQKITYADAWKGFEKSLTTSRIPCKSIERYPVVARWRADVDYVAAGIYCFQPYCVTGELDPPENPLICPQFCVRFNDLDNIGITGRHYSGFIMLGIQVFNYPNKFKFFKDECVEFNYRWLTEELGIDPEEITFIEDVWAGGGNLGPSIEYFVNGLELGNMVFMQYKTFHDGSREELPIKIIDTGIGLERIPWLINGSATSYMDTFRNAVEFITKKLELNINNEIWEKFGPYSCRLNIDEVDNIDETWDKISKEINVDVNTVKQAIAPVKDLYIVLDHTRTVFMVIYDGSLPSNVGGGANVRNILRRVFAILHKNDWFNKLGIDGLFELMDYHMKDLEGIYGEFKRNENVKEILALEYEKWKTTDSKQKETFEKHLKKKGGDLTIDDWILAMESWGIPAERISDISGIPVPGNLYYEISQRKERVVKAVEQILYDTTHLQETDNLFYQNSHLEEFDAKILDVFINLYKGADKNKFNIVILDKSLFYPTSGGQSHDIGTLEIDGEIYNVVNVEKVGKCSLHILDKELPDRESFIGKTVKGKVDLKRRFQLMSHHTGTHIVFAACRRILGPHVWQSGAKKTIEQAHLDITHYKSLSFDEEVNKYVIFS